MRADWTWVEYIGTRKVIDMIKLLTISSLDMEFHFYIWFMLVEYCKMLNTFCRLWFDVCSLLPGVVNILLVVIELTALKVNGLLKIMNILIHCAPNEWFWVRQKNWVAEREQQRHLQSVLNLFNNSINNWKLAMEYIKLRTQNTK